MKYNKNTSIPKFEVQATHKELFEKVYREYFDKLYAFALTITKSQVLAKDVVSEVFFKLYKTNTNLSSIKELKSYLFTCTKNQVISALSKDPHHYQRENFDYVYDSTEKVNPEELLVGQELDEFLQSVIENLPPKCALVFRHVKERGLSYDLAAQELGMSVDTVKYHLKTAIRKIKQELEVRYDDFGVIEWYKVSV